MIKTIAILLPILMLGLVPIANAHTAAYMFGFKFGKDQGLGGAYDISDTCDGAAGGKTISTDNGISVNLSLDNNTQRCMWGWNDGWNTTCKQGIAKYGNEDAAACPILNSNPLLPGSSTYSKNNVIHFANGSTIINDNCTSEGCNGDYTLQSAKTNHTPPTSSECYEFYLTCHQLPECCPACYGAIQCYKQDYRNGSTAPG
jgi:hypothetical protein